MKTFDEKCYAVIKRIPKGKVATYKQVANFLKCSAYRAVGNAMRRNKNAPHVPCHRVVKSNGAIGGYALGQKKKIALLKKEGVKIKHGIIAELKLYLHAFKR